MPRCAAWRLPGAVATWRPGLVTPRPWFGIFSIRRREPQRSPGNSPMTSPRRFVVSFAALLGGAALALRGAAVQQDPKNPPGIRQVVFSPDAKWLAAAA